MAKFGNAQKNAQAIIKLFNNLEVSLDYGCGCNDNAGDAQKEIQQMFENIMAEIDNCSEEVADRVNHILHYNGVL